MVKFYVLQIKLGKITLDDVPTRWREAVSDVLNTEAKKESEEI